MVTTPLMDSEVYFYFIRDMADQNTTNGRVISIVINLETVKTLQSYRIVLYFGRRLVIQFIDGFF